MIPVLPVRNVIITDQPRYRFTESRIGTITSEHFGPFVACFSPPPKATNYEAEQGATDNTTD